MHIADYSYEPIGFFENSDNRRLGISIISAVNNSLKRISEMWGCNLYTDIPFVRSLFSYGFFSLLIWVAIIIALVFALAMIFKRIRNPQESTVRDSKDSLEFLKIRYAKGEIGHEDYIKMKKILCQS